MIFPLHVNIENSTPKLTTFKTLITKEEVFMLDEVDFGIKRLVKGKHKESLIYGSVHALTPTRFQLMTTTKETHALHISPTQAASNLLLMFLCDWVY